MGSVCFEIEGHLFTGDTIFKQNVGNSDNYNGNAEALRKSLCKILELDDALLVEPGHRESTILGDEKTSLRIYTYSVDKNSDNRYTKQVLWIRPRGVAVNMSPSVTAKIVSSNLIGVAIHASVAQSVEQRTENPCVDSSILS